MLNYEIDKTESFIYPFCLIYNMKIENHIKKAKRMSESVSKLDLKEDYELIIEACLLMAAHYINAAMHKIGVLPEERDIKHNKLAGFLKKENSLGKRSEEVSNLILFIEDLRPSHVYGRGENGETAEKVTDTFEKIKKICEGHL